MHWGYERKDLPAPVIDVHDDDFNAFLKLVVAWLRNRKPKKGQLAMNMVRQALIFGSLFQKLFPGLGVYTVNEVWYIAGTPFSFLICTALADSVQGSPQGLQSLSWWMILHAWLASSSPIVRLRWMLIKIYGKLLWTLPLLSPSSYGLYQEICEATSSWLGHRR